MMRNRRKFQLGFLALPALALFAPLAQAQSFQLGAVWTASSHDVPLKSWSVAELMQLKKAQSRERELDSGQLVRWKGTLLSHWIEKALSDLKPEEKAQVDLVVLKATNGTQTVIPRYLITKYPLMLAYEREGMPLSVDGGLATVVIPWTSRAKIADEGLPLSTYFIRNVSKIELTSYGSRYSGLYLKRRTDPLAIRGEKLFLQNCISCHATGKAPSLTDGKSTRTLASASEHPKAESAPKLNERDVRALKSYLEAYRSENQTQSNAPQSAAKPLDAAIKLVQQ